MAEFARWLFESARDTAAYEAWYALGGLVLTGLGIRLARLKGAPRHVLWALGGAATSIAILLCVWLILIWSGQKILLTFLGVIASGGAFYAIRLSRKRERARLAGHRKGLLDFKRDFRGAAARNLRSTARLTKETLRIGRKTGGFATQLQHTKNEAAQEFILNRFASMCRRAAVRHRRGAEAVQRSLKDFTDATTGMLGWLEEAGNRDQLQTYLPVMDNFRTAMVSARDGTQRFRNSVLTLPNVSQRVNASRAELVASIDISLATIEGGVLFCDQTLARFRN